MNIQGKIHAVMDVQQVTDKFRKREFVLEYTDNPQYPQYILFQMVQDRVDLVDGYHVGDMVEVSFNLRGRQWNNPQGEIKYFNSLEAWRIQDAGQSNAPAPVETVKAEPIGIGQVDRMDEGDDDLPF